MNLRRTIGWFVLALGFAPVLIWLILSNQNEDGSASMWSSSFQCASCHAEIYADWKKSLHAQAWTDPFPRELSNNFANKDCISCHAPRPIFETGVGDRVLPRISRREEGVDCIACHVIPQIGVAATREGLTAACRPTFRKELSDPISCAGCHNQHGTVDEWKKTEFFTKGVTCVSCHMPKAGVNPLSSHHMLVRDNAKAIAAAITWEVKVESGKALVHLANTNAGHDFPTDSRHKAVDLKYRILPKEGEAGEWQRLARYRFPYRDDQIDLERTTIPYGEKRDYTVDLPEGQGRIEVVLYYKITPFTKDEDALIVFHETREFP